MRGCQQLKRQTVCALLALFDIPCADSTIGSPAHQVDLDAQSHPIEHSGEHLLACWGALTIEYGSDVVAEDLEHFQAWKKVIEDEVGDLVSESEPALRLLVASVNEQDPLAGSCNKASVKGSVRVVDLVLNAALPEPPTNSVRRQASQRDDGHRQLHHNVGHQIPREAGFGSKPSRPKGFV